MKLSDFNLSAKAENGFTFNLLHPVDKSELDASVTVRGSDSATYRNAFAAIFKGLSKDSSDAEMLKAGAQLLAAATVGWSNITDEKGNEIKFSMDKAVEIYSDIGFDWIVNQVKDAVEKRNNFFLMPAKV